MKLSYLFRKRDRIGSDTIRYGSILKCYPASRSHVKKPYLLEVIDADDNSFTTKLVRPDEVINPTMHTFVYDSADWIDYHCDRFKIIKK